MSDQAWDPMDPNTPPPIRKPGEVWLFLKGKGWTPLGEFADNATTKGEPWPSPPMGLLWNGPTGSFDNPSVAKIQAEWLAAAQKSLDGVWSSDHPALPHPLPPLPPHLDPLWMVKALGIPLGYCAPAPRWWSDWSINRALGDPVIRVILGNPDLVAEEFAAQFGDTSPVPELRGPSAPAPEHSWMTPPLPSEE